jgi:dTDP-4-amino-4,6-dideoxygalactose transaminase
MQFLESWTHERKRIATIYQNSIDKKYLMSPILPKASHVYHIFALRSSKRNALSLHLENSGVSTSIHYPKAIHQNSFYESLKVPTKGLIGAEKFARETLSIPLFPGLTDCEIKRVIDAVMSFEKL